MASTQHNTNSSNTCVHIALEPGSSKTEQSARILAGCKHSLNFSLPFHIIINSTFPHTHPPSSFSSSVVCVTPSLLAHPLSQKSSSITTSPISVKPSYIHFTQQQHQHADPLLVLFVYLLLMCTSATSLLQNLPLTLSHSQQQQQQQKDPP